MTSPFPMVERAVKELIESVYTPAADSVGGDLSYDGAGLYVWLGLVPGGQTTQIEGLWVVDIDCFDQSYGAAMDHALALEALLVDRNHATSTMRLDRCTQNAAPTERPWDDETVFRVGATYTFTARRTAVVPA